MRFIVFVLVLVTAHLGAQERFPEYPGERDVMVKIFGQDFANKVYKCAYYYPGMKFNSKFKTYAVGVYTWDDGKIQFDRTYESSIIYNHVLFHEAGHKWIYENVGYSNATTRHYPFFPYDWQGVVEALQNNQRMDNESEADIFMMLAVMYIDHHQDTPENLATLWTYLHRFLKL